MQKKVPKIFSVRKLARFLGHVNEGKKENEG